MAKTIHAKVVIVGSGPAGYTAAVYAARALLDPLRIQGIQPGGQLPTTTAGENYPGFADVIQGPWLMEQMQTQAEHVGTRIITDHVNTVELAQRPFRLSPRWPGASTAAGCPTGSGHRRGPRGARCRPARWDRAGPR